MIDCIYCGEADGEVIGDFITADALALYQGFSEVQQQAISCRTDQNAREKQGVPDIAIGVGKYPAIAFEVYFIGTIILVRAEVGIVLVLQRPLRSL